MKERITNGLKTLSLVSLGLFLLSFPQSVSVSQIFGGLTIASATPLFFLDSESGKTWKRIRIPFLLFFGIYLCLFFSSLWHADRFSPFFQKFLKRSEFGDFWMLLLFPASFLVASQEKNQIILKRFLFASASIAILLGCISLFSEVRIGKFVANGFKYAPGDRLQHFSGNIGPIKLYLPIGMMNTHLTFGGLLGIFLPGLFVDWFQSVKRKRDFTLFLKTALVFAGFGILFFNQSRSVWLGVFVTLLLLLLKGTFAIRKNLPQISLRSRIAAGLVLFGVLISAGTLFRNNWLIQRSISQIFEVHNTENQRYYIYKNTIPLIRENWFAGVGGGNYKDSHWKESAKMIQANEQLWYELYITPRGHAHNDLLHFFTTGGIFAALLFLLFWGRMFSNFFRSDYSSVQGIPILAIGILSLFPAGFFQCYLLDDEVVLPFFAFCGIFLGGRLNTFKPEDSSSDSNSGSSLSDPQETARSIFSSEKTSPPILSALSSFENGEPLSWIYKNRFFLIQILAAIGVPILLYWLFWIPRLNLEPLEVYNRRVRSSELALIKEVQKNILKFESPSNRTQPFDHADSFRTGRLSFSTSALSAEQASLPFQVEGCLTHRYPNPPLPRKTPFSFTIFLPETPKNSPKTAEITIVSRDSFDQDQLYWAHGEADLFTIQVALKNGANPILVDGGLLETTPPEFPNEVFFRDYKIRFSGFETGKPIEFPKLYFGKICDTVLPLSQ
ncbi:O-antigen ligase family protein [Leptospira yasudae]|uniref:O-antigen ligase family protein n=1 Tax=Leptospira yasudae TaxID=2202201 RepID=A0A6N4QLY4_9LEPT|nr:O-antigen ligase family protein [Leptospira yasudae]TGL77420.1 O-antigen ligase family protein [Leptospira yasudae]TGL81946.1 O-antigen ligase family protein [Leptospira yasudae]TGL84735.1 O-antigen ligase family protein [Leptospira yasudae]